MAIPKDKKYSVNLDISNEVQFSYIKILRILGTFKRNFYIFCSAERNRGFEIIFYKNITKFW